MPNFADWDVVVGAVLMIAFLTETIVEVIKKQFTSETTTLSEQTIQWVSIVLGVLIAWLFNAQLFEATSIGITILNYFVIGLIASRGASFAHNWLDKLPRKIK